jgi:hypothetical protein
MQPNTVFHPLHCLCTKETTTRSTIRATLSTHLAVTPEGEGVVPLPCLSATSGRLVVGVTLSETTALLAGGCESTAFAVLVDGLGDPVDAGIAADGLVLGVDEDDLEVLVGGVLVDPVRVEYAQIGTAAADTLLGGRLEGALVLKLVHTLVGGLAYSIVSISVARPSLRSAYRRWHP